MRRIFRFALLLGAPACASGPSGSLQLVLPPDSPGTLTDDPAVTRLEVDSVTAGDAGTPTTTTLASASLPTATIDLGGLDPTLTTTLTVTGFDAHADRVVFGESLDIQLGELDGLTLPVFVQRTGEMAELPNPPSDQRPSPLLGVVGGRYLFIGGGTDPDAATTMQLYDFVQLAPVTSLPTLATGPASAAFTISSSDFSPVGWFFDAQGGAYQLDFSQPPATMVTPPAGGEVTDVAGGATVFLADPQSSSGSGNEYVVGATRTSGAPTSSVLVVSSAGTLSWQNLASKRLGAAATAVNGALFVAGGCVDGDASCAGAELLLPSAITGVALNYPFDDAAGGGAYPLQDGKSVIVAGGATGAGVDAGVRVFDVTCGASSAPCTPTVWTSLPTTLASAQVFWSKNDPSHALVTGDEAGGAFHVYRVGMNDGVDVLQTRAAHTNAAALISPLGNVVVFGGAPVLESFFP